MTSDSWKVHRLLLPKNCRKSWTCCSYCSTTAGSSSYYYVTQMSQFRQSNPPCQPWLETEMYSLVSMEGVRDSFSTRIRNDFLLWHFACGNGVVLVNKTFNRLACICIIVTSLKTSIDGTVPCCRKRLSRKVKEAVSEIDWQRQSQLQRGAASRQFGSDRLLHLGLPN